MPARQRLGSSSDHFTCFFCCCLFLNFQFEVELYNLGPAGLELTTAQAGLTLATFLPQPLEQQCRPVSPGLVLQRCFHSTPCPQLFSSRQLRLRQGRCGSHRQGLVGRVLIKSATFCLLCFLSLPLSPLLLVFFLQRQAGRQRQYLLLLLLSRPRFPNLVTSGIHPGQVFCFSPVLGISYSSQDCVSPTQLL